MLLFILTLSLGRKARGFCALVFSAVGFFRVTHDGFSERGNTCNIWKPAVQPVIFCGYVFFACRRHDRIEPLLVVKGDFIKEL